MRDEKIEHRDIDLNSLIKAVCSRPKMYVGSEDFITIAAFIQGFAYASEHFSEELFDFGIWLGYKFRLARNVAWFCNLKKIYPNDEDILKKLPILFDEFMIRQEEYYNERYQEASEK